MDSLVATEQRKAEEGREEEEEEGKGKTLVAKVSYTGRVEEEGRGKKAVLAQASDSGRLEEGRGKTMVTKASDSGRVEEEGRGRNRLMFWKRGESDKDVKAFLDKMEKTGLIQSFGCVLLLDETSFRIRALSENVPNMLCGHSAPLTRPFQFIVDRISRSIGRFNKSRANFQKDSSSIIAAQAAAIAASQATKGTPVSAVAADVASQEGDGEGVLERSKSSKSKPLLPLIGVGDDARVLFTRASVLALQSAAASPDMELMNPVLVQSEFTKMPFYAILHKHKPGGAGGLLIDLEPINQSDPVIGGAGALQSHRLAAQAVMRIQSLPFGNQKVLFQAVAEEIRALTGYDRVMVYQFHEDEHGEVVAEDRDKNTESYLGLHFPSSDIPKASRVLFVRNRCRMICNSRSNPVRVGQDKGWLGLQENVSLGMSTMRAVHGCHTQYMANMGINASLCLSLVMRHHKGSLLLSMPSHERLSSSAPAHERLSSSAPAPSKLPGSNGGSGAEGKKRETAAEEDEAGSAIDEAKESVLWGMVVCHHKTPRYVSYPVRSACEFLMQVFGLQLSRELEAESRKQEHRILRLQTMLCEIMLMSSRANQLESLMTSSPGVIDLVKCSGAAVIGPNTFKSIGMSPSEEQLKDLVTWIRTAYPRSTGFTIDSLASSGYPNAASVSNIVCGLAGAELAPEQYLFWFRDHVEKEIHWGGAKQGKQKEKDNFKKQTPRASFATFLEIIRGRSQPWSETDIDAILSLQIILKSTLMRSELGSKTSDDAVTDLAKTEEYKRLYNATFDQLAHFIEVASAPIIAINLKGQVTGWNKRTAKLTGLSFHDACGRLPLEDLLHPECKQSVETALQLALSGTETSNIQLKLLVWGDDANKRSPNVDGTVIIMANTFVSKEAEGIAQGICFLGQDVTEEREIQDQFVRLQGEYSSIIHSRMSIIPPIFGCDEMGRCIEWNKAMEKLTGWRRREVVHQMLIGGVFGSKCRLASYDSKTKLMIALSKALAGHAAEKLPFSFLDRHQTLVDDIMLSVQPRYAAAAAGAGAAREEGGKGSSVAGAFCFLHVAGQELRESIQLQHDTERIAVQKSRDVAYLRQQVIGPMNGLQWSIAELSKSVWEDKSPVMGGQVIKGKQQAQAQVWVNTCTSLVKQCQSCLEDVDITLLEQGYMGLRTSVFTMESVMSAVLAQANVTANQNDCRVTSEISGDLRNVALSGDAERLQQVLAGLAVIAVRFSPSAGLVKVEVSDKGARLMRTATTLCQLEIRVSHTGQGVPEGLIAQMLDDSREQEKSQEGLVLYLERLILGCMDKGEVKYVRDGVRPAFVINLNVAMASNARRLGTSPIIQ